MIPQILNKDTVKVSNGRRAILGTEQKYGKNVEVNLATSSFTSQIRGQDSNMGSTNPEAKTNILAGQPRHGHPLEVICEIESPIRSQLTEMPEKSFF